MKKIPLLMILLVATSATFIHAKKLASIPDLLKPFMLRADQRFIYISDDYGVKIYSTDTFTFQRKIGRLGGGPAEFSISPRIQLLPSGRILITDINKCVLSEPGGNIVFEKKAQMPFRDLKIIGDNFLIKYLTYTANQLYDEISIMDHDFKVVKNLFKKKKAPPTDLGKVISNFKLVDNIVITACYDDKIFLARGEEGFYYEIFDSKGNKLSSVNKPYKKLSISKEDKEILIEQFKQRSWMQSRWTTFNKYVKDYNSLFPEYYPAMQDFFVIEGNVYIKTFNRKNDLEEYVILDLKGNIQAEVYLPKATYNLFTFTNERFYYLVDNDDEETWELHSEEISLKK
ncbi:MAG: hypothetical protein QG657_3923 [Acidobacteriota bacterium]|nr:hypothetical protein [Acidobacteriota bacterium]